MDLLESLLEEVRRIEGFLQVKPARELPEAVELVRLGPEIHATSSLRGRRLLLSEQLESILDKVVRKEALSLFIPREADAVPQVHDLSWIYAEVEASIWKPLRPQGFANYDPVRLLSMVSSPRNVIREVLLLLRCSSHLSFPLYFAILRRAVGRELELTRAERSIVSFLSLNPYAEPREIREALKISDATISRSMRKLRDLELLFGPENVDLWKLDLTVVVADFPNRRKYEDAFWDFPYTYTQMIPISGSSRIHAYLVVPSGALTGLKRLSKYGVKVGVVKRTLQRLNYEGGSLSSMVRAYVNSVPSSPPSRVHVTRPPIRLAKEDIRVLNVVMRDGRVSERSLRGEVRSAKRRLDKLREANIIRRYYMLGSPLGFSTFLVRVRCDPSEMNRLTEALGSLSTVVTHYVEGEDRYCIAVALAKSEAISDIFFGIKAIYGDELEFAEEVFDIHNLWLLPEDLWSEERQTFNWERPLEELIDRLRR